jgi:ankyrin repeat protein
VIYWHICKIAKVLILSYQYAAAYGHTDTVQALLAHGADVNAKSNNSFTALMAAEMKGNTSIVHLLRNAGAIRLH